MQVNKIHVCFIALVATIVISNLSCPLYANADAAAPLELNILSSSTLNGTAGDFVTVRGEIINWGTQAVANVTTYMSLVDAGTKMPVDLEDWAAEKGLFIGPLKPANRCR